jgi:hypothetical protein
MLYTRSRHRAIYEVTWKNMVDDNIIWSKNFACWITKVTDIHPEYVILIALPQRQWLGERVSMFSS